MNSNFDYLQQNWGGLFDSANKAEVSAYADPRTSVFYARYTLEAVLTWLFENDNSLTPPYERTLAAMMHEPSFKERLLPPELFQPVNAIRKLGNQAVHPGFRVQAQNAILLLKHLHLFLAWFAKLYSSYAPFIPAFNPDLIPKTGTAEKSAAELQKLKKDLEARDAKAREHEEALAKVSAEVERYRAELQSLKAKNRKVASAQTEKLDHNESETRDLFIDLMLREAGWDPHGPNVREYEVRGMPTSSGRNDGTGYADYVLWGDDGLPLAVIEVKRTKKSPREGERQAELYARCLEQMTDRYPLIFYSNGYETWFWDEKASYPPRQVQGFLTRDELQLAVNRRQTRADLTTADINQGIVNRPYQIEAVRRVTEDLTKRRRRCLLAMSMGTGKTRTAVAITELLMKANWVRRVLFLADRRKLVTQAYKAFKEHLPNASLVNLLDEKEDDNSRVVISTYPTLMNAIDERKTGGQARFGPGYFDLIWLDEVHRSVYKKYGAIFDYFDSLIIGLTATPRDEVSRNTYQFLELEEGQPTFAYGLDEGVNDRYLCPPLAAVVPLKFQREGIKYADLTEEEQEEYEEKFFDEDTGTLPEEIDSSALNSWLFNADTVDRVLAHVMDHGIKVAGGERLGKTIIFARNQRHAEFVRDRFDLLYPHLAGKFMRVVHNQVKYVDSLMEDFEKKNSDPHIAASVDMLDTGVDIPEVVNLVFFKMVRSRVKFWQMVGRGTRLCEDLFGPGQHKEHFLIFDFCGNLDFFDAHPKGMETVAQPSLSQKIFNRRLILALEIRRSAMRDDLEHRRYAGQLLDQMHHEVAALDPESFVVRPHQKFVRPYMDRKAWDKVAESDVAELTEHVSPLISHPYQSEEAARFDLLIHNLQIEMLTEGSRRDALESKVRDLAMNLELKKNIPAIEKRMPTIRPLQDDAFWKAATVPKIEAIRSELREVVQLLDKAAAQRLVYTDFTDEAGAVIMRDDLVKREPGLENYRRRVEKLIRGLEHDDTTIWKLKQNQPLTSTDLQHLEAILFSQDGALGTREDYEREIGDQPLGLFIRSIVGLDRMAAKAAFADFLAAGNLTADQIAFLDRIINYLTQNGAIEPEALFEAPFTDLHSEGVTGLFMKPQVEGILAVVAGIRKNAEAA